MSNVSAFHGSYCGSPMLQHSDSTLIRWIYELSYDFYVDSNAKVKYDSRTLGCTKPEDCRSYIETNPLSLIYLPAPE